MACGITMHVQPLLLVVATCLLSPPECDALPTCQSCIMKLQPLSLTACTTGFHASTCSWEWMPGTWGYLQERHRTIQFQC